ncbi:unnamed protein product (mitochondrion) [Plasmodiophora brassicae]|uniref:Uncharacterized protein n=1 Tax=Plasmodiophora brassicae TaxID=37360 RepID=A0A0G4J8L7_PLABS|nr:hypothetical protein PBRA_009558 [Plasmodiophora brassicae]SPR01717.1 unnamed protein product [Plasmodiophora brassicae]
MSVVATGCRGPSDNTHSPCRHSTCRCSFLFGETLLQLCGLVISLPFEAAGKRQVVAVFMFPESRYAEAQRFYICRGDTVTNILNDDEVGGYLRGPGARPLCVVYDHAGKLMSTGGEHGADAQSVQRKNTSLEHENGEESGTTGVMLADFAL